MKLITYETANGPRAGVVVDGQVLDIATLLGEQDELRDVRALLELPNDPLTRLKSALGLARAGQGVPLGGVRLRRSEEHTSELQSRFDLVCRLLLEKKK